MAEIILRRSHSGKKWGAGILIVSVFLFLFFFGARDAIAATIYLSPAADSVSAGRAFSVTVYISSPDQAMNAASGVISFPPDLLSVTSLSKNASIANLWVQDPSFSNTDGTINFEGVVLNPGFTGAAGRFITINFKAKSAGAASVKFSSASVLANDGSGSNILTSSGNALFTIGATPEPGASVESTKTPVAPVPAAPDVSSPTYPDQSKWYAQKEGLFTWTVPPDVTGVRLLVNKIVRATPTVRYIPAISQKKVSDFDDGVSYIHVQFRNTEGWGDVAHYKVQIDTVRPSLFDITEISQKAVTKPTALFVFTAKDELSGIDHYEIQIDSQQALLWTDDGSHRYETPALNPGKHTLLARAVDRAGNFLTNSVDFTVGTLETPVIESYPKELPSGGTIVVSGSAYADTQVIIWLKREGHDPVSHMIRSDNEGKFSFVGDEPLADGAYALWAESVDASGARSKPTEKFNVIVGPSAFTLFGYQAISFLSVVIPLVALVIILMALLWYGWHRLTLLKKKLKKEVTQAESVLHKAFELLKEDLRDQVRLLERARTKRQLTEEEEKIVKQLKKDMDEVETLVKKEIENIERDIK